MEDKNEEGNRPKVTHILKGMQNQLKWENTKKQKKQEPIPVTARSKAWFCGYSLAGIAGSNPVGGMDICLLWFLSGVRQRHL
jgi:hypothetical protein